MNDWIGRHRLPAYTRDQLLGWLYRKKAWSFEEMTNLSAEVRETLEKEFSIGFLEKGDVVGSEDGTKKFLFRLSDGQAVETVLMPMEGRVTLCVSTQVGCAMGCKFCKTAEMGLVRNLTQGEILGQVIEAQRLSDRPITNVVFMGMGEPLHNYDNVVGACRLLIDKRAFGFAARKVMVSTVGLADKIGAFKKDLPVKLAISLNATSDAVRGEIMPINRAHTIEVLLKACRAVALQGKDRFTFEYVLFAGLNDSPEDAKRLARLLTGIRCKVNLIPYNEYEGSPYKRPSIEQIEHFYHALADRDFQVNIRWSKGDSIMAGCGQLYAAKPSGS